ncbi:MAG: hypothetical protein LBF80_01080 [Spirochaetaceae bacterium]|jgi:hypothetical protein|nr:hypothetical protein [Spirochaetaceae bacterium]
MKLDKTFENEIKKIANGDGGREYRFAFINELKKNSAAPEKRYEFAATTAKYGRVKVSICIAATMSQNAYRYESEQIQWATAVMNLWTNIYESSKSAAFINQHPCVLADLSRGLRNLTTEGGAA